MLDKDTKRTAFLDYRRLYILKICALRHAICLVEKISALLCFLDGFGIAASVFSYKKHPTRSSIV